MVWSFVRALRGLAVLTFASGCAMAIPGFGRGPSGEVDVTAEPFACELAPGAHEEPSTEPDGLDEPATDPNRVSSPEDERCPEGMILVEGDYCPSVTQKCRRWMESPEVYSYARCAEFEPSSTCTAPREHRRFCIDAREYTPPGEDLPAAGVSFRDAEASCTAQGKRLCSESEWQFACEGEGMLPYPYGYARDPSACNFERTDLYQPDGDLRDLREASGANPACKSPFGVMDMVGNVDEWTVREDKGAPHRSALRGGWWMPGRNRCRAATTAHDEIYRGPQTGFRCCAWPG
jgi:hypothetical protein